MSERTRWRALGREAQVGAAEGDDPRVGVGARDDGETVRPGARRRTPRRAASVAPCEWRRRSERGACSTPSTSQAVATTPPAARTSSA